MLLLSMDSGTARFSLLVIIIALVKMWKLVLRLFMIPNRLRMVLPLKWVLRRELFFFFFLKKNSMIVRCVIYDFSIPGRYIASAAFLKAKINNDGILVCSCFSY